MRIDENSYYLKCDPDKRTGKCSVHLSHYKEVWDDGFTVDDYIIYEDGYYFEDAGHSGVNIYRTNLGTRILAREFNHWVNMLKALNEEILKMARQESKPLTRTPQVGDWLFYEYEPDEEEQKWGDYRWSSFIKVEEDLGDSFRINSMGISRHGIDIMKDEDVDDTENIQPKDEDMFCKAMLIDESVYQKAVELINKTTRRIIEETQKRVK